ncbi:MAG: deoxyribodipyrimidine photo-lyase [Anaerolineae bacterium]|nr:deoxyribodipyrimidine photo-lyase [Anaerolineae bacterium]
MKTVLWWIRRDLRLADNQALAAALNAAERVVPVFVLDPALLASERVGPLRVAFLLEGLRRLDSDLRQRGSRLVLRRGDPAAELSAVAAETGAGAILAEEDFTPYARQRDSRVPSLQLVGGRLVHPPGSVRKADGTPYVVYTPFSRTWKGLPQPGAAMPAPAHVPTAPQVASLPVPDQPERPPAIPFPSGETEAQRRLAAFVTGDDAPVYRYAQTRDRVDLDGTSQLSPYLHLGMISSRQAVAAALDAIAAAPNAAAREGAETWLNELIWREFYVHILYHFPHVLEQSFRANLQEIRWQDDASSFAAWRDGCTGYPIVDAAMRQLAQTGWMHNRARMVAASFLIKDLLIDWRWGERYFMQTLIDGDSAANNGGWQWTAGTGTDAAPYFRVFHPVAQGRKHDPQGTYVRRWLPELGRVPERFVHQPWKMPDDVQQAAGCVIGRDYPAPIVDHAWARERALDAYRHARRNLA